MPSRLARAGTAGLGLALLIGASGQPAHAVTTPSPTSSTASTASPSSPSSEGPTPVLRPGPFATPHPTVQQNFSLTVSPTRLELNAGQVHGDHIFTVTNRGRTTLSIDIIKNNFVMTDAGAMKLSPNAPYGAAGWTTFSPTHLVLPTMTSEDVHVKVVLPRKPDLGDHHVSMAFLVPAGKTARNIKINRGIAAPLLITVPGPTTNTTTVAGLSAPRFALRGPVTIQAAVRDTGTVHRDFRGPAGQLRVQASGSGGVFPDFTVLRGSVRDISTTWNPPLACVCTVSLSVPAADGSLHPVSATVFVFPFDLLALAIGLCLVLYLANRYRRRLYRARVAEAARSLNGPVWSGPGLPGADGPRPALGTGGA